MTEEEWLTASDPAAMLEFIRAKTSDRKLRLFACACCRNIWHLMKFENSRIAIDIAERFAEGGALEVELQLARRAANVLKTDGLGGTTTFPASRAAFGCTNRNAYYAAREASSLSMSAGNLATEKREQLRLIHCIFSLPIVADPAWLTDTVQSIATAIYRDRAFDRLPILADAFEEAGCTNADVLLHCRKPAEHVRGCWVVDLVLGKQ